MKLPLFVASEHELGARGSLVENTLVEPGVLYVHCLGAAVASQTRLSEDLQAELLGLPVCRGI